MLTPVMKLRSVAERGSKLRPFPTCRNFPHPSDLVFRAKDAFLPIAELDDG